MKNWKRIVLAGAVIGGAACAGQAREDLENAVVQAGIDAQTYYFKAKVGALQVDAAEKRVQTAVSQLAAARSGLARGTSLKLGVVGA